MQTVFVGEYIKRRRKELKLTQEKVCEGICDPTTLSRIENGHQTPSKTKINALLQRLGLPDSCYYAITSKNELEIETLKKEIVGCHITERVEEGFDQLEKLREECLGCERRMNCFVNKSSSAVISRSFSS